MRIKVETNSPHLPKIKCWIALNEKQENATIHQLRKKLVSDLSLSTTTEPSQLSLSMDSFGLLPSSIIKDTVRDGDLITIKAEYTPVKLIERKRKLASVELQQQQEQEKHDIESTVAAAVTTKSKKSKQKDTLTTTKVPVTDATKPKESKKDKKKKDAKETQSTKDSPENQTAIVVEQEVTDKKKKKKKAAKGDNDNDQQPPLKKHRSEPFDGLPKTKKRNMRRRLLREQYKNKAKTPPPTIDLGPVPTVVEKELQVQNLTISQVEPSLQLIKQNKNKKKHHLKQLDQPSHVHYDTSKIVEEVEEEAKETTIEITPNNNESKNRYGRAFVTFVESDGTYKSRTRKQPMTKYPIHRVPTLFYADQGLSAEEMMVVVPTVTSVTAVVEEEEEEEEKEEEEKEQKKVQTQEEQKPIDYELDYPEVVLGITPIGSKLAIKMLEMSANYTPEISDWKQVILKSLNDTQATFEFLPGFGKANTKGGKFDNKKHSKKNFYDGWFDGEEQIVEEEEEEEEQEQEKVTVQLTDIFASRIMS